MVNYTICLENVTNNHIEVLVHQEAKTLKGAIAKAKKLSSGKAFKDAHDYDNGGQKGYVRVWVESSEPSNDDEYGCHTMSFENGVCTYNTIG